MPELAPSPAQGQPQGQPQQQAPFGASPATGPTPNKGYEAAAMQRMGLITKQLTELLNLTGVQSEQGKNILKMLDIAAKMTPSGSTNPAQEKGNIERMAMQNAQQNSQMQALKQQSQGGQPGAPGGAPSPMPQARPA